jgi:hypothetical protein
VGTEITVDRREEVILAKRGRGADRDGFMPVSGVQGSQQITGPVHADHPVLDGARHHHRLEDPQQELLVAALHRLALATRFPPGAGGWHDRLS